MSVKQNGCKKNALTKKMTQKNKIFRKLTAAACSAVIVMSAMPMMAANAVSITDEITITASTAAKINLRSGAGSSYDSIKVLTGNTVLTLLDISNPDWYKVRTDDGDTGYCAADKINILTEAKAACALTVYSGPGSKYSKVADLESGKVVNILGFKNENWVKVQLTDDQTGYIEALKIIFLTLDGKEQNSQPDNTVAPDTYEVGSTLTLSESSAKIIEGSSYKILARYAKGTVTWKSNKPEIAKVDSNGRVSGISAGAATITAIDSVTKQYAKCVVTVIHTDFTSLSVTPKTNSISVGQSYQITAATSPATTGKVKFKSLNKGIATVDSNGKVTGVAPGTATIKAYDSKNIIIDTCTVTVKKPVTLTISQKEATVSVGSMVTIKATATNTTAILWKSSDNSVAAVNNGRISGLKAGTATITATDASGTVKASCKVTVKGVSSGSLSVSHSSRATTAGKTVYIKGYGSGWWQSSDTEVATVSEGFIYCKKAGKVAISYVNSSGNRAVCAVTVSEAAPIRFAYSSPNSATLNSNVKLVAITDKTRTNVKFMVNVNGKNVSVDATNKTAEGNTYVWTGYYKTTAAGQFEVTAYSLKDGAWKTCADGKSDVYVSSKTNTKTTALESLRASDGLISFIGDKEGFVSSITYDTLAYNVPTIGHGYVVSSGEAFYNNLTRTEAFALLVEKVNHEVFTSRVNEMLLSNNTRFNQQQFDALVSFSYNLGTGWTYSSDLKNILMNSYGTVTSSDTKMIGVVTSSDGLNLRKEPTTSSDALTVMPYGSTVTLVSTTKYNTVWYKVTTSSGLTGYCSSTYLNVSSSGGSTTGRDLNYVNKNALIKEMLAYHHAGGNCYYGLLYRRVDELEMFLYGDYTSDGRSNKHSFPSPYCLSF